MTPDEAEARVARLLADRLTCANLDPDPAIRAWLADDAEALSLLMSRVCSVDDCGRPVQARGLCPGHYQQQRNGEPFTPLRTARGEGDRVTVSMTRQLRTRAAEAGLEAGLTEGEWWKLAGEEKLQRDGK